ncbi:LysM peptidoglycan-binding domain-containing protein [Paenibacillus sp. GYB004]|uniref:LysM peptidoglycan-binding domain-containing protein n=1 Tax=Paenibacillus sp. GYB004 TaxID=2994393 RepID=UPI002F96B462
MSNYGIWLSFNNQQEGFQVPINPGSIEIGNGGNGRTYDVAGLGEVNVIKDPKLAEYSFSGIFPAQRYPFVAASILLEPQQYIEYLQKWQASKRPIRFVFTGASFELNTPASIENFDWKESAGGSGDIEYTLRLKRYVFYAAQRVSVTTQSVNGVETPVIEQAPPERPNDQQPPNTHLLAAGESLWAVAKRFFDDGARWKEIQQLNGISDAQLKSLPVGYELKLPDPPGGTMYA